MTAPLPSLVLYGRPGCHLCEDARASLLAILADRGAAGLPAPSLEDRDIETDEGWHRRYAFTIPVIVIGDRELELATSPARVRRLLADVLDAPPIDVEAPA
ncbi:MAG: glutaredoxin family protein [Candidatus Limnocylindrales bacterium]